MNSPKIVYRSWFSCPVPAERVYSALTLLKEENEGELTPADVVEAATPIGSPLHPCFEWNDTAAAAGYRIYQARNLIRAVIIRADDKGPEVHAFTHVTISEDGARRTAYMSAVDVVQDADLFDSAMQELRGKLNGVQTALNGLLQLRRDAALIRALHLLEAAHRELALVDE